MRTDKDKISVKITLMEKNLTFVG